MKKLSVLAAGAMLAVSTITAPATSAGATADTTLACSVSKPAFGKLPFRAGVDYSPPLGAPRFAFAAFTATRDGIWAGYAFLDYPLQFAAIRWHRGQRHATVLQRFHPGAGGFNASAEGNINIAGITPRGAVIAAVRPDDSASRTVSFVWLRGQSHHLMKRRSWRSVYPLDVADDGAIFGLVSAHRNGTRVHYFVEWPHWDKSATILMKVRRTSPLEVVVDRFGDIAFQGRRGYALIRLRSGAVRRLTAGGAPSTNVYAASGSHMFGRGPFGGTVRWDLGSIGAAGPIEAADRVGPGGDVTAAGTRGDFLLDLDLSSARELYVTATGGRALTPRQSTSDGSWRGQAINQRGVVAYTARSDGLPHFLRCTAVA